MNVFSDGQEQDVEMFGTYAHTLWFRTIDEVNRCVPLIVSTLGEGVEDVPPVEDKDKGGYAVDLMTNEQLTASQIASIRQVEGGGRLFLQCRHARE